MNTLSLCTNDSPAPKGVSAA